VEDPSAPRRHAGRQAPPENGSLSDLLWWGGPPTASSSLHHSRERPALAAAMSSPPLPGGEGEGDLDMSLQSIAMLGSSSLHTGGSDRSSSEESLCSPALRRLMW
jgi:hypothetical protein